MRGLTRVGEFIIFLSSGNDLRPVRDRIEQICDKAINPHLFERSEGFRIRIDRWEHSVPQRVKTKRTNEKFVAQALNSHLTVVLIQDRLGPGTREELDALLDEPERGRDAAQAYGRPEVAVIRFPATPRASAQDQRDVDKFLERNRDRVIYAGPPDVGDIDSPESWMVIFKVLLSAVLSGKEADLREFSETR